MPSRTIRQIDYDAEGRTLTVTFPTGRIDRYDKVEPEVADAFRIAASKGWFFQPAHSRPVSLRRAFALTRLHSSGDPRAS